MRAAFVPAMLLVAGVSCLSIGCSDEGAASAPDADPLADDSASALVSACTITAPPGSLHLDPFYGKYCSAQGLPVIGAKVVSDDAIRQATRLATAMMSHVPSARAALVASGVRMGVIGERQLTTDMPEYRGLPPSTNERGRGYGAVAGRMLGSAAEENILCHEHDRWRGENIFVHEFAHTLKNFGLELSDATFAGRVKAAFDSAIAAGLYQGYYAATDPEEYWAEGAQDYFDVHQVRDPNDVNTKERLRTYDPALFAILDEVFAGVVLPPTCPLPTFDRSASFRISNVALGGALSLDGASMAASGNFSGQSWRVTPLAGGWFRLADDFQPGFALDTTNDGVNSGVIAPRADQSGQLWKLSPVENGRYRLTTAFLAEGRSLEPKTDGSRGVVLAPTADVATQWWTIERIP